MLKAHSEVANSLLNFSDSERHSIVGCVLAMIEPRTKLTFDYVPEFQMALSRETCAKCRLAYHNRCWPK